MIQRTGITSLNAKLQTHNKVYFKVVYLRNTLTAFLAISLYSFPYMQFRNPLILRLLHSGMPIKGYFFFRTIYVIKKCSKDYHIHLSLVSLENFKFQKISFNRYQSCLKRGYNVFCIIRNKLYV